MSEPVKPVFGWHIFHRWEKWSEPKTQQYEVVSPFGASNRAITRDEQTRVCVTCGLLQVREVVL